MKIEKEFKNLEEAVIERKRIMGMKIPLFPLLPSPPSSDHSLACSSSRNHVTIVYNSSQAGINHCDTSELQALAILWNARIGEMEEKYNKNMSNLRSMAYPLSLLHFQLHSRCYNNGLSLRKSLQRFLQKRRERRTQAAAPY